MGGQTSRHATVGVADVELEHDLVHTPSVQVDLASGMSVQEAQSAQSMRRQLRIVDAELSSLRAEMLRAALLRGPSGKRLVCDKDVTVGGCGEEFAEEDGVRCSDCELFLCFRCFGSTVVTSECQVGGRFDAHIDNPGGFMMSESGSLPCPLFPQACQCAHVALHDIQRALLHPGNRGEAGADEDTSSAGLSPHKIFLLARRRFAESQIPTIAGMANAAVRSSMLVRTVTEARHAAGVMYDAGTSLVTNPLRIGFTVGPAAMSLESSAAMIAERQDEIEQLRDELRQRPVGDAIPPLSRRCCSHCAEPFAVFEGAQCLQTRNEHFLCNVCFGSYLLVACAPGGCYEQALTNADGMVVSPPGKLPCPFFQGHSASTSDAVGAPNNALGYQRPAMDCQCGAIAFSVIERTLLDPRNSSAAFWRERRSSAVVNSHKALARTGSGSSLPENIMETAGDWAASLLSRNFTPANVHETARLRVSVMGDAQVEELLNRQASVLDKSAQALADLHTQVIDALDRGGKISCPKCGLQCIKDDACVHMDSCPCGSSWCFLCGKESGKEEGQCPRGEGGCDAGGGQGGGCYLERHTGWEHCAIAGEDSAQGAQKEFLRRRQAFLVRKVKEKAAPEIWERLQRESPGFLKDVPTFGREIEWETLDSAEPPLFGANRNNSDGGSDMLSRMNGEGEEQEMDADAQRRLERHFEEQMDAARLEAVRERRQVCALLAAPLVLCGEPTDLLIRMI